MFPVGRPVIVRHLEEALIPLGLKRDKLDHHFLMLGHEFSFPRCIVEVFSQNPGDSRFRYSGLIANHSGFMIVCDRLSNQIRRVWDDESGTIRIEIYVMSASLNVKKREIPRCGIRDFESGWDESRLLLTERIGQQGNNRANIPNAHVRGHLVLLSLCKLSWNR